MGLLESIKNNLLVTKVSYLWFIQSQRDCHTESCNYHDSRFAKTDWLCRGHKARENEQHLISGECEVFGELRNKFGNINNLEVLTKFFDAVLKKRDEMDS